MLTPVLLLSLEDAEDAVEDELDAVSLPDVEILLFDDNNFRPKSEAISEFAKSLEGRVADAWPL